MKLLLQDDANAFESSASKKEAYTVDVNRILVRKRDALRRKPRLRYVKVDH
jgi:hypothetical protein